MPNTKISFENTQYLPDRLDSSVNLPPEHLTDTANFRLRDGVASVVNGYIDPVVTFSNSTTLADNPHWAVNLDFADSAELLYLSAPTTGNRQFYKVTVGTGATVDNTVQTLSGAAGNFNDGSPYDWTSFGWGETTVLQNPGYAPVYATAGATNNNLLPIPNWQAADRTQYIFPLDTFLVGLGYTGTPPMGATAIDTRRAIITSDEITQFNEFPTWELGSATSSTSAIYPTDGHVDGDLIAGGTLGDRAAAYTDSQSLIITNNGDGTISLAPLWQDVGILSRHSWTPIGSGQHFCIGSGQIYIHDGNSKQVLGQDEWVEAFFEEIQVTRREEVQCVYNARFNTVWMVIPVGTASKHVWVYDLNSNKIEARYTSQDRLNWFLFSSEGLPFRELVPNIPGQTEIQTTTIDGTLRGSTAGQAEQQTLTITGSLPAEMPGTAEVQTLTVTGSVPAQVDGVAEVQTVEVTGSVPGLIQGDTDVQTVTITGDVGGFTAGTREVQHIDVTGDLAPEMLGTSEIQLLSYTGTRSNVSVPVGGAFEVYEVRMSDTMIGGLAPISTTVTARNNVNLVANAFVSFGVNFADSATRDAVLASGPENLRMTFGSEIVTPFSFSASTVNTVINIAVRLPEGAATIAVTTGDVIPITYNQQSSYNLVLDTAGEAVDSGILALTGRDTTGPFTAFNWDFRNGRDANAISINPATWADLVGNYFQGRQAFSTPLLPGTLVGRTGMLTLNDGAGNMAVINATVMIAGQSLLVNSIISSTGVPFTAGPITARFQIAASGPFPTAISGTFSSGADGETAAGELRTAVNAAYPALTLSAITEDMTTNPTITVPGLARVTGSFAVANQYAFTMLGTTPTANPATWADATSLGFVFIPGSGDDLASLGAIRNANNYRARITVSDGTNSADIITTRNAGDRFEIESIENAVGTPAALANPVTVTFASTSTDQVFTINTGQAENLAGRLTLTAGSGTNVAGVLDSAFTDGAMGTGVTNPATTYTVRDYAGRQITSFTRSVTTAASNDLDLVNALIESAIDTNTETPTDFIAENDSANRRLILRAQSRAAVTGTFSVTVNHGAATGADRGNIAYTPSVSTQGTDTIPAETATVTITDANGFAESFSVSGTTASETATAIRDNFANADWTASGAGARVILTANAVGPQGDFTATSNNPDVTLMVSPVTPGVNDILAEAATIVISNPRGADQTLMLPARNDGYSAVQIATALGGVTLAGWSASPANNRVVYTADSRGAVATTLVITDDIAATSYVTARSNPGTNDTPPVGVNVTITNPLGANVMVAVPARNQGYTDVELAGAIANNPVTGWTIGTSNNVIEYTSVALDAVATQLFVSDDLAATTYTSNRLTPGNSLTASPAFGYEITNPIGNNIIVNLPSRPAGYSNADIVASITNNIPDGWTINQVGNVITYTTAMPRNAPAALGFVSGLAAITGVTDVTTEGIDTIPGVGTVVTVVDPVTSDSFTTAIAGRANGYTASQVANLVGATAVTGWTANVVGNVITFTRDVVGPVVGEFSGVDTTTLLTFAGLQTVPGEANRGAESVTVFFTDPVSENTFTAGAVAGASDLTATQVATMLRASLTIPGWTVGGTGADITLTNANQAAISGEFQTSTSLDTITAQTVVTRQGFAPITNANQLNFPVTAELYSATGRAFGNRMLATGTRSATAPGGTGSSIFVHELGSDFGGDAISAYLERTQIQPLDGYSRSAMMRAVPFYTGTGTLTMRFGGSNDSGDETEFLTSKAMVRGTDTKIDMRFTRRYISYRFESSDSGLTIAGFEANLADKYRR